MEESPVFDAVYVAIGEIRRLPVYTADEGLFRKLPDHPFLQHIKYYHAGKPVKAKKIQ